MARQFVAANPDKILFGELPDVTSSVAGIGISFSYWYNHTSIPPTTYPNRFCVISRYGNTGNVVYYLLEHDTGISLTYTTGAGTPVLSATETFDTGAWHHVAVASDYTLAGTQIYLDGISQSVSLTGTAGTPLGTATTDANAIGNFWHAATNADPFNGKLADVAVWNARLTASEAYALAKGVRRPASIRPGSLVFNVAFDNYKHPAIDTSFYATVGTLTGTSFVPGPPLISAAPVFPGISMPPQVVAVTPPVSLWAQSAM